MANKELQAQVKRLMKESFMAGYETAQDNDSMRNSTNSKISSVFWMDQILENPDIAKIIEGF